MISMVRRAIRRRAHGDDGVGLILVIGVAIFVFLIAAVAVGYALNGVAQSRNRQAFEKSLSTAENGIDFALGKVQESFTRLGADYPIPATSTALDPSPSCNAAVVNYPPSGDGAGGVFSSEAAERTWARTQLDAIAGVAGCIQQGDQGEYVILKPPSANLKYGHVYALSAMPSFAHPSRTRLVKDEYIFMPYRPAFAILSGGNLDISSSTTVTSAAGTDPSLAGVHSNGVITGTGNPTVYGPVSSTGTSTVTSNRFYNTANAGGAVTSKPTQQIPFISALGLYAQAATLDSTILAEWYDLCPNGDVRDYSASGPCTGAAAGANIAGGGNFRGWTFDLPSQTWTATRNVLSGTYYVDQGNVVNGSGNATIDHLTVIASASNPTNCSSKRYGNITWNHYALSRTASLGDWLVADSDLVTTSNFTAGQMTAPVSSGMFVAGDQIQMETSSQGAVGSVIAANQCATAPGAPNYGLITSSQVKNPAIYYDANADAAFTSVITTALWLDYSGS